MAKKRGRERGRNLRQGQRPHLQLRRTRVAKGLTHGKRGHSLSHDQSRNDARNEPEIVHDGLCEFDRCNQETGDNEEDWNERSLAEKFQLLLRGVCTDRGIDRQSGQEGPAMPGRLMRSASTPATTMMPSMV